MEELNMRVTVFCIMNVVFIMGLHLILSAVLPRKEGKRVFTTAAYMLFYFINTLNYIFVNDPNLNFLAFAGCLIAVAMLCYKGKVFNKVIICTIIIGCIFLIEMASAYFVAAVYKGMLNVVLEDERGAAMIIVMSKFLTFSAGLIMSGYEPTKLHGMKVPYYCVLFLLVPLCSLMMIMCCFMGEDTGSIVVKNGLLTASIILILLVNIGIYLLFGIVAREYEERMVYAKELSKLLVYQENSEIQKMHTREMERLRHDTKKMLVGIKRHLKGQDYEKAFGLIDTELHAICVNSYTVRTGYQEVDNLVNHKISYAESIGIKIEAKFLLSSGISRQDIDDICILTDYLLDHAVASCRSAKTGRQIRFFMETVKGFLRIRVTFPYFGEVMGTKASEMREKEIRKIIGRHQGSIDCNEENQEFCYDIVYFI